jgi:hypothetical protein
VFEFDTGNIEVLSQSGLCIPVAKKNTVMKRRRNAHDMTKAEPGKENENSGRTSVEKIRAKHS